MAIAQVRNGEGLNQVRKKKGITADFRRNIMRPFGTHSKFKVSVVPTRFGSNCERC